MASVIVFSTSLSSFATNISDQGVNNFVLELTEEEIEESLLLREKVLRGSNSKNLMNSPDYYNRVLNVPVFQQPNDYYCGPATTKQVAHFINGQSQDMVTIATSLGTSPGYGTVIGNIRTYLNSNTRHSYQIEWDTRNYSTWENQIKFGMDNNKPAVLLISPSTSRGWAYSTSSGHYVNTSGLSINTGGITPTSSMNSQYLVRVRVTDPWGAGLGNRWYNSRTVWDQVRANPNKCMLY